MRLDIGLFPVEVDIFLSGYDGPRWEVAPFRHRCGWLMVSEAYMMTAFGVRSATLIAAISDHSEPFLPHVAARLLDIPASMPRDAECEPPMALETAMDVAYWDFLGTVDLECLRRLEEAQAATDARIHTFEAECEIFEAKLWAAIRALTSERRGAGLTEVRRAEIEARLARYLDMPQELALGMRRKTADMRDESEALEEAVLDGLTEHGEIKHLSVVRWRARFDTARHGEIRLSSPRAAELTRHLWQDGLSGRTLERIATIRVFSSERE